MKNSFLFLFLFLSSCGYQLGRSKNNDKVSVCVPYIKKDFSGLFTSELIKQMSYIPNMNYSYLDADYTLKVDIIDTSTKQIGYKYDRNNQNVRQKVIRATEGRYKVTAKIELIEKKSNITKFGPFIVSSSADFDYVDQDSLSDLSFIDPNTNLRTNILSFSLGQLESIENAKEASLQPLYEKLSKKIVDAISAYW